MTKGYAWFAMTEILILRFVKKNCQVYTGVCQKKNQRAIRFYNKHYFL